MQHATCLTRKEAHSLFTAPVMSPHHLTRQAAAACCSQHLPAHVCYLLAGRPLNFLHQADSGYCLVGADHSRNPRTYCSVLALQRSEVLEWSGRALAGSAAHAAPAPASSFGHAVAAGQGPHAEGAMGQLHGTMGQLHGSAAGAHPYGPAGVVQQGLLESNGDGGTAAASSSSPSLPLLPYKLWYAHVLAEAGKVSEAVQYCQVRRGVLVSSWAWLGATGAWSPLTPRLTNDGAGHGGRRRQPSG